jgi:hypothetical protein
MESIRQEYKTILYQNWSLYDIGRSFGDLYIHIGISIFISQNGL